MIARAFPDGHTVGYATPGIATNPSLYDKLPYDSNRDFQAVAHQHLGANLLVVTPLLLAKSVQELIAYARAQPGKLPESVWLHTAVLNLFLK